MKTAKVTIPDQKPRYIPDCENFNGFLCQMKKVGKGKIVRVETWACGDDCGEEEIHERYEWEIGRVFFNSKHMAQLNISQKEVENFINKNGNAACIKDSRISQIVLKWGENPCGYFVEDENEAKKNEQDIEEQKVRNKETVILFTERYGLRCETRLPADIWSLIKKHATYIKGDDADMDFYDDQYPGCDAAEVRGWVYQTEAISILLNNGFKIKYRGFDISNVSEIPEIDKNISEQSKIHFAKIQEIKKTESKFSAKFRELQNAVNYDLATEKNAEIKLLPEIHCGTWKGSTIYGGGCWFKVLEKDLILIINNGHDGDDWSRNNYETGGAGAIAYYCQNSISLLIEYQTWINSLGDYITYLS